MQVEDESKFIPNTRILSGEVGLSPQNFQKYSKTTQLLLDPRYRSILKQLQSWMRVCLYHNISQTSESYYCCTVEASWCELQRLEFFGRMDDSSFTRKTDQVFTRGNSWKKVFL